MTSRHLLVAALVLAMQSALVSCTYNVTSPAEDEIAAVAFDPNLQVTGLETFKQTIQTEGSSCIGSIVELDYRDYAHRRSQLAWQTALTRGAVEPTGTLKFESLEVWSECSSGSGMTYYWTCTGRAGVRVSFADGDLAPVKKFARSEQVTDLLLCSDAADVVQLAVDTALDEVLQQYFGPFATEPE